MGQYTSYYLYQKYEQRGEQEAIPVYPNVYSIDADGTKERVIKIQDDPQCGYDPPIKPIYKWVNIPITQDYVCDDCPTYQTRWVKTDETTCIQEGPDPQYRWVNMDASVDYYCEGTTKYYKQKKQVSFDGGQTWRDVVPAEYQKGGVAEEQSTDCGYIPPQPEPMYRWVNLDASVDYYCEGTTKYYKQKKQVSYDSGTTWTDVVLAEYQRCGIAEIESIDCGFMPPEVTTYKHRTDYLNGTRIKSRFVPCASDDVITYDEIKGYTGASYTNMIGVNIGRCVTWAEAGVFSGCTSLTSVILPNTFRSISNRLFAKCTSLSEIYIPNSVTGIYDYAFSGCTSLQKINIPNSVTIIGSKAFSDCASLKSVIIPDSVTSIGDAFIGCTNISITVNATTPPRITSSVLIDSLDCTIYVPAESVEAYKTHHDWEKYASVIQEVPCYVPTSNKLVATYTGGTREVECNSNTTLTSGETQPSGYDYHTMTSAVIGNCVTSIGNRAFEQCTSLTSIDIPNSVTSIGGNAFTSCSGLISVTIGNSVTSIAGSAFEYCFSLTSITVNATTPPTLGDYVFDNTNNCPIYVPASSVSAYKSATNWSTYASRIQPIT